MEGKVNETKKIFIRKSQNVKYKVEILTSNQLSDDPCSSFLLDKWCNGTHGFSNERMPRGASLTISDRAHLNKPPKTNY